MIVSIYKAEGEIIIENVYAFYPIGCKSGFATVTDAGVTIYSDVIDFHVWLPE